MALKELLLAAILQWHPPWYPPSRPNPETQEQYQARLAVIAEAVALEAKQVRRSRLGARALAAATMTIWYGETRFSYEVHALGESRWTQDRGKARCLGQIHVSGLVPKHEWEKMVGADLAATRRCARATMRVLAAMSRYCSARFPSQPNFAKIFAGYGSGRGCKLTEQANKRARRWARLMQHI